MKLTFSLASPFARKVRIAAIELGLIDKIEFVPATVVPGTPNDEYSQINPLKKLPALILDNGDVILDSYVITEYLDELAGGGKLIPASGALRWRVKSEQCWSGLRSRSRCRRRLNLLFDAFSSELASASKTP
jgi:glutathione S-transferase